MQAAVVRTATRAQRKTFESAATRAASTIAFLGLGNMGQGMATNLVKAGHQVTGFDPVPEAREACAAKAPGLMTAATVAEAMSTCPDYVVSMLPTGKHALDVYMGDDGLLATASRTVPNCTMLDCSTIDAETAVQIGEAAAQAGIGFMDTPVSGGTAAAAAGNLAFMCGGQADTYKLARPILACMGPQEKIFHAGPAGAGQVAKACNNMMLAIHMIGSAEVLEMGARAGLAPEKLSEILLASSGRNWSLEVYNPYPGVMPNAPASKGYAPGFMVDLMLKDLNLAMDAASKVGLDIEMGALARRLYMEHQAAGHGSRDFSCIMEKFTRSSQGA